MSRWPSVNPTDPSLIAPPLHWSHRDPMDDSLPAGLATVGLKNKKNAVLVAFKRPALAAHREKIIRAGNKLGISVAASSADALELTKLLGVATYFRVRIAQQMNWVQERMRIAPLYTGCPRPDLVGSLIAGYDDTGPQIYQTCPGAEYHDCNAMAIGARSQPAVSYLESHLDEFESAPLNDLVGHGLRALRGCLPRCVPLDSQNVAIAIVGKKRDFTVYENEECVRFLRYCF